MNSNTFVIINDLKTKKKDDDIEWVRLAATKFGEPREK